MNRSSVSASIRPCPMFRRLPRDPCVFDLQQTALRQPLLEIDSLFREACRMTIESGSQVQKHPLPAVQGPCCQKPVKETLRGWMEATNRIFGLSVPAVEGKSERLLLREEEAAEVRRLIRELTRKVCPPRQVQNSGLKTTGTHRNHPIQKRFLGRKLRTFWNGKSNHAPVVFRKVGLDRRSSSKWEAIDLIKASAKSRKHVF